MTAIGSQPSAYSLQVTLLGNDPKWWRHAYTVANGIYSVRTYPKAAASQFTVWDHHAMFDPSHCRSCTRPLRLFGQISHSSTLFCKRWNLRCMFCEWKLSNADASRVVSFNLWPSKLGLEQWERVIQFLCHEGEKVIVRANPRHLTITTPHLRYLLTTAAKRMWHSVLLTGLDQADEYLWAKPERLGGIFTSGSQSLSKNERAAWALLSIMCGNPMWLLVASCCPTTTDHHVPVCGRPMQILLSFLTGHGSPKDWKGISLDLGSNPHLQIARLTAGEASTAYTSRPAFQRWAGRGRYAQVPLHATAER